MSIDAAAERPFRIIEVERADVVDADVLVELLDRRFVALASANIVAGREDVARVDADTDAR